MCARVHCYIVLYMSMAQRVYVISDILYNEEGDKVEEKKISIFSNKDIIKGESYKEDIRQKNKKTIPIQECLYYLSRKFDEEEEGYWQYVKNDRILR